MLKLIKVIFFIKFPPIFPTGRREPFAQLVEVFGSDALCVRFQNGRQKSYC